MLKLFCFIILISLTLFSQAQGSWNIGYLPIDSINKTHIGNVVKIDFKTLVQTKSETKRSIRSYVGIRDTALIAIDNKLIRVVERRRIFVDHVNYYDQYLECLDYQDMALRIYDAEIIEIDEESILFKIETEISKASSGKVESASKSVRIEKAKLDGVLYKL